MTRGDRTDEGPGIRGASDEFVDRLIDEVNAMGKRSDKATADLEAAHEECQCGHPRHRHVGCGRYHHDGPHEECCDEDDCPCRAFLRMGRVASEATRSSLVQEPPKDGEPDNLCTWCKRPMTGHPLMSCVGEDQRSAEAIPAAQYKAGDRVLYQGVEYKVEEVTFYGPNENVLARSPTHGTVSAFAPSFTLWPKGDGLGLKPGDRVYVRAVVVHTLPNQPEGAAVRVRMTKTHRLVNDPEVVVLASEVEHETARESVWKSIADGQAKAIVDLGQRLHRMRESAGKSAEDDLRRERAIPSDDNARQKRVIEAARAYVENYGGDNDPDRKRRRELREALEALGGGQ